MFVGQHNKFTRVNITGLIKSIPFFKKKNMSVVFSAAGGGLPVPYVVPGAVNLYSNNVVGVAMGTAPDAKTSAPTVVSLKPEPASPLSSSVFTIAPTAIPQDVFTARSLAPWLNNNGTIDAGPFTSRGVQSFNVVGAPPLPPPMIYAPTVMPSVSHISTVVPSAGPALTMAYTGNAVGGILGRPSVVGGYAVW